MNKAMLNRMNGLVSREDKWNFQKAKNRIIMDLTSDGFSEKDAKDYLKALIGK